MAWWRRRSTTEPAEPGDELAARPGESDRDHLTRLVDRFLPEEHRAAWLGVLRPAVRLRPAGPGEPVVMRLGGHPRLPADVGWPQWPGHGPLAFVGEIDLAALAGFELDIALPRDGRVLLFYFDDRREAVVGPWDPESLRWGVRLLHLHDTGAVATPPPGATVFDSVDLTGVQAWSEPDGDNPALRRAFGMAECEYSVWKAHPVHDVGQDFADAVHERWDEARHQIGGWATSIQGSIDFDHPELTLLVQVASDVNAEMLWGDFGSLYWSARPADLDAGDLSRTTFEWQH